ncbi:MAG: flagellar motor protein MotD [Acidimicrobiia bacterium]|nr:MAG: flagellar motor protein MotD [Acidimicrobiia bacterium]GIU90922.1 MAG: flagellar motor protein MotD [Acidimicrobiia bacterium]
MSHGGDDGIPEEHEEHVNHEAWVIPYADLLTLLMAMFIALFAMSTVDLDKFKELSIGFAEALGGGELSTGVFDPTDGGAGPFDGTGSGLTERVGGEVGPDRQPESNSVLSRLLEQYQTDQVRQSERESFTEVAQRIEEAAAQGGFVGDLDVRIEERGLVVTVVTDQVLFDSGSADLRPEADGLLVAIAEALAPLSNPVIVEGHTDPDPISLATSRFRSNRELSGARAAAVTDFFERHGVAPARLRAEGYADTQPIADNSTAQGKARNRRVEIVVQSNLVERTLDEAGLGSRPAGTGGTARPGEVRVDGGIELPGPDLGG